MKETRQPPPPDVTTSTNDATIDDNFLLTPRRQRRLLLLSLYNYYGYNLASLEALYAQETFSYLNRERKPRSAQSFAQQEHIIKQIPGIIG